MEAVTTPELPDVIQTPERGLYLSRAVSALATVLVDSMLSDLDGAGASTGGRLDRAMTMALRPWMPKLRGMFLGKLSETDPAGLERLLGAVSTTIETILRDAPGEPLDRWTYEWLPGEAAPHLVPLDTRP